MYASIIAACARSVVGWLPTQARASATTSVRARRIAAARLALSIVLRPAASRVKATESPARSAIPPDGRAASDRIVPT
jgi:hypothetical protein